MWRAGRALALLGLVSGCMSLPPMPPPPPQPMVQTWPDPVMALADLEHGETEFAEGDVPLALEEAWQAAVTVAARSGVVVSVDMPSRKVGFFDGDFYGQSIQLTGYGARTRVRVSGAVLPGFSPFILREALDARPALTLEAIAREGMGARQWTLIFGT